MFQEITLLGRLTADPESRFTPSGVPVATFTIAVNKTWTDADGQRKDKATFFRVTTWRKQAETVGQYLQKKSMVLVVGELEEARTFTDKSGNARASLEVTAQTVKFISGTRGSDNAAPEESSDVPW